MADAVHTTGFVYVIASASGPVKIGHSNRPKTRLSHLQVGAHTPLRLAFVGCCARPHSCRVEAAAHRRLSKLWVFGEWYDTSVEHAVATVLKSAKLLGVKLSDSTSFFSNIGLPIGTVIEAPDSIVGRHIITREDEPLLSSADAYARAEKASATLKAYQADLRHFAAWCETTGETLLPARPQVVAAYIAGLADARKSVSTIIRRLAAIAYAHRRLDLTDPTDAEHVKQVVRGIKRTIGTASKQKAPATAKFVRAMMKALPDTMIGRRDRALLLIGFAGALRRSELVALDVADIERQPEGILVRINRSKTDQDGAGQVVAIPRGKLKIIEALDGWLAAAGIVSGPIFRPINKGGRVLPSRLTDQSVALVIKHRAAAAKLDPALFSGHSLRAGFVTSALEDGADTLKVMDQTRHRSVDTLRKYDRRAKAFVGHAGKGFL